MGHFAVVHTFIVLSRALLLAIWAAPGAWNATAEITSAITLRSIGLAILLGCGGEIHAQDEE
jgi:hypothetical protein